MINNFEDPISKKQFYISAYKTKVEGGRPRYYRSGPGWEELKSVEGVPLVKLHLAEVPLIGIKTGDGSKV